MKHENGQFTVNKAELRAIVQFGCTDNYTKATRGQLSAIHFAPSDGAMVATDGHTLVKLQNGSTAEEPSFTASIDFVKRAAKLASRKGDEVTFRMEFNKDKRAQEIIATSSTGGTSTDTALDVKYPPYNDVIPAAEEKDASANVTGFNAEYFARMAIVQKSCERSNGAVPQARHYRSAGDLGPELFVLPSEGRTCTWSVVIMPMRIS